ncbi:bacterial regulatory s, tetR family protein [Mycolicibacterium hassiacum DSM 44199]|jgi:AcrR family transcriptional regulator|uniref:Bacterial regulatory s, tetR family protein n=1 Tax=Mycolicibacterium hassiacum (strain DSM 44199 / CIP 105218 / JCM 12690 / 3849) TaxID=1122247 RepID=K5BER3_MYCHD|nr:TetR/AcrR family transcriptional regulator [Mycolicibacterium hassiacum]EKF23222.1 bacterial regulatory s, tetR family protein [Mycolicibacterium hassiacum DSM 44199]MBX5488621.1 TetR/AcrR family transcriptional regulator [Mycolicibacterium hassiacum]MDA4087718.1 TetR family transcriptional regulator [Mycolicibacterium hassiacum DSM 44199]VCT89709.1 putative HTH-type transcriptional regulator [Mycolicibacterium hassiacum DSM 44199]
MSPTSKAGHIVAEALTARPLERDTSDTAILEATLRCLTRYGMDRMTVDDVARAAGVGRATVFRRFESKDDLIRQAIARELRRLTKEFIAKAGAIDDPYQRVVELSMEMVRIVRTHPVGRRLVEDESALGLYADPRIAKYQRTGVKRMLDRAAEQLGVTADTEAMAELLVRFYGSVWLAPEISPVLDEDRVRRMITIILAPLAPA